jgi:peroxiredoxin
MSRWLLAAPVWAMLALSASAQDPAPAEPKTTQEKALAIKAEYEAGFEEFREALQKAATEEEKAALRAKRGGKLLNDYVRRLLEVAEADPADPGACEALVWIVSVVPSNGEGLPSLWTNQVSRTFEILAKHHADDPRVARTALQLEHAWSPYRDRFLQDLHEKARDRTAKGTAALVLAEYFERKADFAARVRLRPDRMPIWTEEFEQHMRTLDVPALEAEAERLYETVIGEYGDVPYARYMRDRLVEYDLARKQTLADIAKPRLYAMRHLAVGKPAPEIEGADLDGRPMKLSDYRGKVVLVVFWHSATIGRTAELPRLAEKMKGRPFALLGVACDEDPKVARAAAEKAGLTWPSWADGRPREGPIATRHQILNCPASFLLDARGIIREKRPLGFIPAEAVEDLVKLTEKPAAGGSGPR